MNTTPDHDEHEFVPEVDAAALLAANPPSTQTPPVGSAAPLPAEASQPDDPEQALKLLPPALTAQKRGWYTGYHFSEQARRMGHNASALTF